MNDGPQIRWTITITNDPTPTLTWMGGENWYRMTTCTYINQLGEVNQYMYTEQALLPMLERLARMLNTEWGHV